jgi:hypothetical protein
VEAVLPEQASAGSAAGEKTKRRRRRRWLWALLALPLTGGLVLYYYAFNNWSWCGQDWIAAHIDESIRRGLDHLYETQAFAKPFDYGGEHRVHHWFLEHVLAREEHAGLRAQMDVARVANADNWTWRAFAGLPGWPPPEFRPEEWQGLRRAMYQPSDSPYSLWLVYALYPRNVSLSERDRARLFGDTDQLVSGYDLTHALACYLWLREIAPDIAERDHVAQLIPRVSQRLLRGQTWDARPSDLYNERVALWLYMPDGPAIRPRWIERIILTQNRDGGWTFPPDEWRLVQQMLGLRGDGVSHPHTTLLAIYALVEYREQLRAEGVYPQR